MDSANQLTVFDGRNDQSPIIAQLCSNKRSVQLISSGSDLYIEFISGPSTNYGTIYFGSSITANSPNYKGINSGTGFRAYFKFIPDPQRTPGINPGKSRDIFPSKSDRMKNYDSMKNFDRIGNQNAHASRESQIPSTEPDPNQFSSRGSIEGEFESTLFLFFPPIYFLLINSTEKRRKQERKRKRRKQERKRKRERERQKGRKSGRKRKKKSSFFVMKIHTHSF